MMRSLVTLVCPQPSKTTPTATSDGITVSVHVCIGCTPHTLKLASIIQIFPPRLSKPHPLLHRGLPPPPRCSVETS